MKINRPLNRLGQKLFGINDRRSMRDLDRPDSIAIFYRGKYVAIRPPKSLNFANDKRLINIMLEQLGFRK